jgi:hypothetical protein
MKRLSAIIALILFSISLWSQSPQKLSYQAIIRNAEGKLVQNSSVGVRFSILQGSPAGLAVYVETHQAATNVNGLVTLEIGNGSTTGSFASIDWAAGPYFLASETDPAGGTNFTITGVTQLLSVPYALYAETSADGFSGDYNDLTNKPITDGSETRIHAGAGITLTGTGTVANPYVVNCSSSRVVLTNSQNWIVPDSVSKIRVELWGGAGGGGGAGTYSYSYNLNTGGSGGSGGYATEELNVTPGQQFYVTVGNGGTAGINAVWYYGYWYGDTDGGSGSESSFGSIKAAGGTGGKRGSFAPFTMHGNAGTANNGSITAYSDIPYSNILDVYTGLVRSYIHDRILTSRTGKGGSVVTGYSTNIQPTSGEGGCAIITFIE